jgi:hypothetical protein
VARRKIQKPQKVQVEISERDFVLARVAAAQHLMQNASDTLNELVSLFMEPADDEDGEERSAALEAALEQIGGATRALESAEQALPSVDFEEIEPWDEEEN